MNGTQVQTKKHSRHKAVLHRREAECTVTRSENPSDRIVHVSWGLLLALSEDEQLADLWIDWHGFPPYIGRMATASSFFLEA